MNDLSIEKKMTVREIAEILGVTPEAIKKHIRKFFPDKIQKGKTTYLDEKEITLIKMKMLHTTQVVSNKTQLEKELIIQQALTFQQEKIIELENQNLIMRPKAEAFDSYMNIDDLMPFRIMAVELELGRNKMLKRLRSENILDKYNIPYQKYIENNFFKVKKTKKNNGEPYNQTFVTNKGLEYCRKKLIK